MVLAAGSRSIEHVGSAHDDEELAVFKAAAAEHLAAGQAVWDALCVAYESLGFASVTKGRHRVSRSGVGADH